MFIKKIKNKFFLIFLLLFFFVLFIQVIKFNSQILEYVDIDSTCVCANDGMFLIDYDGPKAQILWKNGTRSFFCEPREAFYEFFSPINKNRLKYFFVQDFGGVPWGSYTNRWFPANMAFFVIDSYKDGAMGVTYVSFKNKNNALAFQTVYGGDVLFFKQITPKIILKSNELLKQRMLELT